MYYLNDYLLAAVDPIGAPGALRHWYNTLVGAKYNSTGPGQKKRGRKPISKEIVDNAATGISLSKRSSMLPPRRILPRWRY